jgi:hypothetical protein
MLRTRARFVVSIALLVAATSAAQTEFPRRVFVRALDRTGEPIPDLTAGDFDLAENGVARVVTRVTLGSQPPRIVLVVDSSTTMKPMLGHFRNGLRAFLEVLPDNYEVAIVSTGRQMRIRTAPTTDRARLRAAAETFTSDDGRNAFLDSVLESYQRFLRPTPSSWPVLAILTTDFGGTIREPHIDEFSGFVTEFIGRGGTAYALLVQGANSGITSELASHLAAGTAGVVDTIVAPTGVPQRMQSLAQRITGDHRAMHGSYQVEYLSPLNQAGTKVEVQLSRPGATLQVSFRRSF